jgi:hypothetical protein
MNRKSTPENPNARVARDRRSWLRLVVDEASPVEELPLPVPAWKMWDEAVAATNPRTPQQESEFRRAITSRRPSWPPVA